VDNFLSITLPIRRKDDVPLVLVPGNLPPRMAVAYQTVPLLRIFERSGTIAVVDWNSLSNFLSQDIQAIKNTAQDSAQRINKKIPVIYSSAQFFVAAYKWKIDFNENAKVHALCNFFPELNHNEINGFDVLNGNYVVFLLRDAEDHLQIKRRMDVTERIVRQKGIEVLCIHSKGTHFLARLFWMIMMGDWISYYAALAGGVDPLEIPIIEDLKKEMKH
jgi:glucose/mannose-6-phosphate isomerase